MTIAIATMDRDKAEDDIDARLDAEQEITFDRAIWYGSRDFDNPYPGEDRVLYHLGRERRRMAIESSWPSAVSRFCRS